MSTTVKEFFVDVLAKLDKSGYDWDGLVKDFPATKDESMLLVVTGEGGGRWGLFLQPQAQGRRKLMMVDDTRQFQPTIYLEVEAWAVKEMLVKSFSPYGLVLGYPEACSIRYRTGTSLFHLEQMSRVYERLIKAVFATA